MAQVRIGIVGGGPMGSAFPWHRHPHCRVTAVCDPDPSALSRLAQGYGVDATFSDFDEFLRFAEMDAVAVFTPLPLHAPMSIAAMNAGKHVICAVTAAMTTEELAALVECARRSGLKYMMAETSFYYPEIIACRDMAARGEFGTIFFSESEYHHQGLESLYFDASGKPTWRYGFPPFLYATHCTGMIIPVTGERLTEVQAIGWGDGDPILKANAYENPFWNGTAFYKTSGGHAARIAMYWRVAAHETVRAQFYGDKASYLMSRPDGVPATIARLEPSEHAGENYPQSKVVSQTHEPPNYFEQLPEELCSKTGHFNSHAFLVHEFISAIVEDRQPAVDVYEAAAYTLPGIVAHQSALRGGELLKIENFERPQ